MIFFSDALEADVEDLFVEGSIRILDTVHEALHVPFRLNVEAMRAAHGDLTLRSAVTLSIIFLLGGRDFMVSRRPVCPPESVPEQVDLLGTLRRDRLPV